MNLFVSPHIFLVCLLAGWLNREQQKILEYLQEENRVLREHTYEARIRQMLDVLGSPDSAAAHGLPEGEAQFRNRLAQIRDTVSQGDKLDRQDRIVLLAEAVRTSKSWSEIGYGHPRPER